MQSDWMCCHFISKKYLNLDTFFHSSLNLTLVHTLLRKSHSMIKVELNIPQYTILHEYQ